MDIARRALFNSLRMNWLSDPSAKVEQWQVEDYRSLLLTELYTRLRHFDLDFDRTSFTAMAGDVDSPEELCDGLIGDANLLPVEEDQVYLLVFELWRRFITEKPCLSVFCDELDHQMFAYDQGNVVKEEEIQDAIANLEVVLDENTDEGADPAVVFESIANCCANDLETFLYDYISQQIDTHNLAYAADLLESFEPYFRDISWFEFLRARLYSNTDPEASNEIVKDLVKVIKKQQDLDLSLELLAFLAKGGKPELFLPLVRQTVSMLETEEDFQELLAICSDYYHFLDQDHEEQLVVDILKKRSKNKLEAEIGSNDPGVKEFLKLMK
jgi:hypothetical protein